MATRFLNSLSSIIYVGQIFGVMPVLRRRRQPEGSSRRQWQGRPGGLQQSSFATIASAGEDGMVCIPRNMPQPVTMAVLNLHDKRVFGEDDANGIVNITADMSVKDYVESDKSLNANEGEQARRSSGRSTSNTLYYVTQFNWKYPNTVYSVMLIVMGVCEWTSTVHAMAESGITLGTIGAFNFYSIAIFEFIVFFHLARKWPRLYTFWEDAARVFDELPYRTIITPVAEVSPGVSIKVVFWVWTLLALLDTVLYRSVSVFDLLQERRVCNLEGPILESFYGNWRPHIYHIIDFHVWQIPILEIINLSFTFTWTYLDIFIMMLSIGLRGLFEMFHRRLEQSQGKRMPHIFWSEIRTHYVILRNLVEVVDQHISILIMISFASNLYFICLQLFNSFTDHYRSWIHIIYYCTNLLMVIVRAMAVLKCASGIASAAKRPLAVLRRIPTDSWNEELQRLFDSISHDVVALSGGGFFTLTKSLFLVMVGTVATYELVIMDVHSVGNQTEGGEKATVDGIICQH